MGIFDDLIGEYSRPEYATEPDPPSFSPQVPLPRPRPIESGSPLGPSAPNVETPAPVPKRNMFDDLVAEYADPKYASLEEPAIYTAGEYAREFGKAIGAGAKGLVSSALKGGGTLQAVTAERQLQNIRSAPPVDPADPFAVDFGAVGNQELADLERRARTPVAQQPLYRAGQEVEEFGKETLKPAPGYENSWTRDIGSAVGSLAAGIGISAVPYVGPGLAATTFLGAGSGEATERAIRERATEEQIRKAGTFGSIAGATDVVDILLPSLGGPGRALGFIAKVGRKAILGAATEGGQEGVQQLIQNSIARGVYKPDQDILEDVPKSVLIGAIVGAPTAATFGALETEPVAPQTQPQQELPESVPGLPEGAIPAEIILPTEAPPPAQNPAQNVPENIILGEADEFSNFANDLAEEYGAPPQGNPNDSQVNVGLSGEVGVGQEPVQAGAVQGPSPEAAQAGGVVQEPQAAQPTADTLGPDVAAAPPPAQAEPARPLPGTPVHSPSLQELLADERPAAEIRAEMEAAKAWQPTAEWQEVPRGAALDLDALQTKTEAGKTFARIAPAPGTREAPVQIESPADLDAVAGQVAPDPTPAQKNAENYPMAHGRLYGQEVSIETPKGGERTASDGSWSVPDFPAHYGRFKGTVGADGQHVDFYYDGPNPFILDQIDPATQKFDEHKVVFANDEAHAQAIYDASFPDGSASSRLGALTPVTVVQLRNWLKNRTEKNRNSAGTKKAFRWTEPKRAKALHVKQTPRARGPLNLLQFLAAEGGLSPDAGGELKSLGLVGKGGRVLIPGLGFRSLVRPGGRSLDRAWEHAVLNGYLGDRITTGEALRTDVNDLLRALADGASGQHTYAAGEEAAGYEAEQAMAQQIERERLDAAVEDVKAAIKEYSLITNDDHINAAARQVVEEGEHPVNAIEHVLYREAIERDDEIAQDQAHAEAETYQEAIGTAGAAVPPIVEQQERPSTEAPVAAPEREQPREAGEGAGRQRDDVTSESGAEGKPQLVIPGAEKIGQGEQAQRRADKPMRPTKAQKPADEGLFGDESKQTDLVDMARKPPAPPKEETERIGFESAGVTKRRRGKSEIREDEPPLQDGFVRVYRGGEENSPGNRLFFSANRAVAEGYADRPGTSLWYLDLPENSEYADKQTPTIPRSVWEGKLKRLIPPPFNTGDQKAAEKSKAPAAGPKPARPTASWVVKNKATGEVMFETFDRKKVDALNTDKYVAIPIQEYLAGLNKPKTVGEAGRTKFLSEQGADTSSGDEVELASVAAPRRGGQARKLTPRGEAKRAELERALTEVVRRIAGGDVDVKFTSGSTIDLGGPAVGYGEAFKGNQARASYLPASRIIKIALAGKNVFTAALHEAWHDVEFHLLDDKEASVLKAGTERMRKIVAQRFGLTKDQVGGIAGYEIRAMTFEVFAGDRANGRTTKGLGNTARLFEKIRRVIEAARNALRGLGFKTIEDIFEAGYRGEFAGRPDLGTADIKTLASLAMEEGSAPERAEKMQGLIARGQPIDRAFRVPFDWFGGVTKDGKWKPGIKLNKKAVHVIVNAELSPNGVFRWINPLLETARSGLIDRYNLRDMPEYVEREREHKLDERAYQLKGMEVMKALAQSVTTPAEARVMQAVLTGEEVGGADMQAIAAPIRTAIDQMGQEAVALGLVSPESFERNRGTYLHRVYAKHEDQQNGMNRMVNSIMGKRRKRIIGDQLKGRGIFHEIDTRRLMRDIKAWHEGAMGAPQNGDKFIRLDKLAEQTKMVLDGDPPPPKVERTVWLPAGEPIPDRYSGFRNVGTWEVRGKRNGKHIVWRDFTKDERTKMGEILDARYTTAKTFQLMAHDLATGKFYQDIAQNEAWAQKQPQSGTTIDAYDWQRTHQAYKRKTYDWVKVPDTAIAKTGGKKRWGALAGMYVREEIWRDLNELEIMQSPPVWRNLMTQFKLNKTARVPVTHMNNVMSNFMLADMLDVRWQDLVRGVASYYKQDQFYKEAFESGAFGSDMMTQEIRDNILRPILEEISKGNTFKQGRLGALGHIGKFTEIMWTKLKFLDQKMLDLYRIEDEVFRMAAYIRRRELGDDVKTAAATAREQFIDYDIRAPWVRAARNTFLPFISYTYRAAPLVARTLAERPWKLAKYWTLAYAANAAAYALTGGDEEKERKSLREREQGRNWLGGYNMTRWPWNDKHGNPMFLDIRRWIPGGDIVDMSGDLPAWLSVGGPLMTGYELYLNRAAFTGEDIVNTETDDLWRRMAKRGDYVYKALAPSAAWVPGSWYWDRIVTALRGGTDGQGRPYSVTGAALSSIGIKLKPQDVQGNMGFKKWKIKRTLNDLKIERGRVERRRKRKLISDSYYRSEVDAINAAMKRAIEKGRELTQ